MNVRTQDITTSQPPPSLAQYGLFAEEPYPFDILQARHVPDVIALFTHTFCAYEPMTKYLGIEEPAFRPFAERVVTKAAKDGLSLVAMDGNKVIACAIVEDAADPLQLSATEIDPGFKYIFALLEQLSSAYLQGKEIGKNQLAHLFITAIDEHYQGKGLSKKINTRASALAQQKKFDLMICEFTNAFNEKGTLKELKNNRFLINTCLYNTFVYEGRKPFETLEGSANAYLWELREGAQLLRRPGYKI